MRGQVFFGLGHFGLGILEIFVAPVGDLAVELGNLPLQADDLGFADIAGGEQGQAEAKFFLDEVQTIFQGADLGLEGLLPTLEEFGLVGNEGGMRLDVLWELQWPAEDFSLQTSQRGPEGGNLAQAVLIGGFSLAAVETGQYLPFLDPLSFLYQQGFDDAIVGGLDDLGAGAGNDLPLGAGNLRDFGDCRPSS